MAEESSTFEKVVDEIPVVGQIVSILGALFGGDGGQGEALAQQAAFNKQLIEMLRRRENVELPFRENLLQGLSQRSQKQFPGFKLPAQPPTFNPFSRMRTSIPQPTGPAASGPASFLRTRAQRPGG